MPKDFEVQCTAPPSKFAYVEAVPKVKKEERKGLVSAVLSATQRRKQREQIKRIGTTTGNESKTTEEEEGSNKTGIPTVGQSLLKESSGDEKTGQGLLALLCSTRSYSSENNSVLLLCVFDAIIKLGYLTEMFIPLAAGDMTTKTVEVSLLQNPCRVVPGQESFMCVDIPSSKWVPIDQGRLTGIVMLHPRESTFDANGAPKDTA